MAVIYLILEIFIFFKNITDPPDVGIMIMLTIVAFSADTYVKNMSAEVAFSGKRVKPDHHV